LNLNHLSLIEVDAKADGLREVLKLYNFSDAPEAARAIQGIVGIGYERSVARVPTAQGVQLCRGIDIELKVEKDKMTGVGLYLFSSVLDRILSSFVSINSFTRFKVLASDHESGQEPIYVGAPRIGDRILL
jgi:type VI secretion system protein ImpG